MGACGRCTKGSVVSIGVALLDGSEAVMSSCTACESRSWRRDGVGVSVGDVLPDLASRRRRPFRTAR
ncbi:MAG: hypothetical protein QOG64_99 [Acidimicrobiaceae bacterium]|jgi:hypothetical protein|nr:hypothetical protein [Acidimicrobiaceae bacterium]